MSNTSTQKFLATFRIEGQFPHKGRKCHKVRNYHDNSISWIPVDSVTLAIPYLTNVRHLPAELFDNLPADVPWPGHNNRVVVWVSDAAKHGLVTSRDYRYSYQRGSDERVYVTLPAGSRVLAFEPGSIHDLACMWVKP